MICVDEIIARSCTLLGYLKEWKESVDGRTEFDKTAKAMMLSNETTEALKDEMAG